MSPEPAPSVKDMREELSCAAERMRLETEVEKYRRMCGARPRALRGAPDGLYGAAGRRPEACEGGLPDEPRNAGMTTAEIADNYERKYGFMAVNATLHNAEPFGRIHDGRSADELKAVRDELLRRGRKPIRTQAEYRAAVSAHGLPPAFRGTEVDKADA